MLMETSSLPTYSRVRLATRVLWMSPCPARLPGQASRVWSWLAAVFSAWRDAVGRKSPDTHLTDVQACWLLLASTLFWRLAVVRVSGPPGRGWALLKR